VIFSVDYSSGMEDGMSQQISATRNSRRGNYMMAMGVFLPVMVGFAALSVDISYINMARTQTQNVADAASHAAFVAYRATGNQATGTTAAENVIGWNNIGNSTGELEGVDFGEWDFDNLIFSSGGNYINSARARVGRKNMYGNQLDLFFAPILGMNEIDVGAKGVAAGRTRQIMLITDVSCSFADDIGSARDANIAFLDYMNSNPFPGDQLGQSIFAGMKNFPLLHELASPVIDYGSLNTQFAKLEVCSNLEPSLQGSPTWEGDCYTSQARGLHYAMREFITNGDPREFQANILITDGKANTSLQSNSDGNSTSAAEDDAEMLVKMMWDGGDYSYQVWECPLLQQTSAVGCSINTYSGTFGGGVHLWTVYFGSNDSNVDWLQSLTAFDGNRGESKDTDDPSKLDEIMLEIAASIPVVLTD